MATVYGAMSMRGQGCRQVIPLVGLGRQHAALAGELRAAFERVLGTDAFILGGEVEAFEQEFAAACRLDHPHIVPVFDVGRTEDGLCFVVSKLVEGSDLADVSRHARQTMTAQAPQGTGRRKGTP